jgi:hypothetical protein
LSVTQLGRIDEPEYNEALSPVITFKNRSSTKTILEHDVAGGNNTSGLSPFEIMVENGIRKTGTFTIRCYDDGDWITNGDIGFRNRVTIKAKKAHQSEYQDLINGLIIDIRKIELYDGGHEAWELVGQSMKHIWNHTHVDYERNVPFLNMKENQLNLKNSDKKYWIGNIIYDIFTNRNIFPNNNGKNLMERGNFTLNGIDRTIPLTIPATKYTGPVDGLLNQLAEMGGLLVGVDEKNDVFARMPVYKSSGHMIKTKSNVLDNTDYTCYTRGQIEMNASTDPSQYAEVVIGQADTSSVVSNDSSTNNYTTLYNKDIAQQIELRSTELYELTLILSKLNAGTDSGNPENTNLRGYIANDINDRIGEDVVAELSFPLRDIPATPLPISRKNVVFKRPIVANNKYWLVLQEIGSSDENTVLWWHDDGYAVGHGAKTVSAIRDVPFGRGEGAAYIPTGWKYLRNQQVYSNTFTSQTPILHVSNVIFSGKTDDYLDPAPVEIVQSPVNVHDSATMIQHLSIFNEFASRIVKSYSFGDVSIPNKLLIPGTSVVYLDTRSKQYGINITDISYNFTVGDNLDVLGATSCNVAGIGYLYPTAGDTLNPEGDTSTYYCSQ